MDAIKQKLRNKNSLFSLVCIVLIAILLVLPTGFEKNIYLNAEGVKAKVLSTDESTVYTTGLLKQGSQVCQIEILQGSHKGEKVEGVNLLTGQLEFDKLFEVGDKAFVIAEQDENKQIVFVTMVDHYRLNVEVLLIGLFIVALIVFSGSTGVRTVISFIFSLLSIWKVLIPMLLKGYNPMFVGLGIGITIITITLLLVAGFTKKAYCAILGAVSASLLTGMMAILFGDLFKIHGAVMPWSESLLYAGYQHLNLTLIYQAAIYLSCSGAILDLAIDISAAIEEIVDKKPSISRKEIWLSGMTIGRSVVGSASDHLTTCLYGELYSCYDGLYGTGDAYAKYIKL